jgi:uncharacterized protein
MRKNYDYQKIKNEVGNLVKKACYSEDNKFGEDAWDYHILIVAKRSLVLGKKLKADLEVLELAALLHDYASIVDYKFFKEHHIHGAQLAEEILLDLNCPREKTEHIKECILNHRGSRERNHKSVESEILASADAMSHFSELADMFYLTYGVHKLKTKEGAIWLKNKLEKSWNKIMPEGRKLVQEDYDIAMKILDQAINGIK